MWIEPNGVVKILKGVPIDEIYNNTLYFANRTQQLNYFNSKVKYTYPKITYQRVKKNKMRVEINAENLYDCNYLMFQNASFGNRWFYAFIKKVEYLSNMVSEIEYELDVIQTWFLNGNVVSNSSDCTMLESFVEREHSVTDIFGANRVEENLEIGDYMIGTMTQSKDNQGNLQLDDYYLIIASTVAKNYTDGTYYNVGLNIYSGIPSGLHYTAFETDSTGLGLAQIFIDEMLDADKESLADLFLCPKKFVTLTSDGHNVSGSFEPITYEFNMSMPQTNGAYTPKNKKLLQYPYQLLMVTDLKGNVGEYQYENFDTPISNGCTFEYALAISSDPSMQLIPKNYKTEVRCINEQLIYKGYPHGSWNTDMWKMYTAQNGGVMPTLRKEVTGAVAPVLGAIALAGITGGISIPIAGLSAIGTKVAIGMGVSKVMSSMQNLRHHYAQPPSASGNFNGDVMFVNGSHDFYFAQLHIRQEFAERIDKFFDMFGYATKMVKVPNINSRPHWNYIQTINANIMGDIPSDDLAMIKEIFNAGITFWKNGSEVGNYSLDNRPV